MANSTIKDITDSKDFITSVSNAKSIIIDFLTPITAGHLGTILCTNGRQGVLAVICPTSSGETCNVINFSSGGSGSKVKAEMNSYCSKCIITREDNGTLWGVTQVIVSSNDNAFYGGVHKFCTPRLALGCAA